LDFFIPVLQHRHPADPDNAKGLSALRCQYALHENKCNFFFYIFRPVSRILELAIPSPAEILISDPFVANYGAPGKGNDCRQLLCCFFERINACLCFCAQTRVLLYKPPAQACFCLGWKWNYLKKIAQTFLFRVNAEILLFLQPGRFDALIGDAPNVLRSF
jgi:hypothetical protein